MSEYSASELGTPSEVVLNEFRDVIDTNIPVGETRAEYQIADTESVALIGLDEDAEFMASAGVDPSRKIVFKETFESDRGTAEIYTTYELALDGIVSKYIWDPNETVSHEPFIQAMLDQQLAQIRNNNSSPEEILETLEDADLDVYLGLMLFDDALSNDAEESAGMFQVTGVELHSVIERTLQAIENQRA